MKKILFISHDANRAGAQLFLLTLMQYFKQKKVEMHLLLLDGGSLENDFRSTCEVTKYPKISDYRAENISDKLLNWRIKHNGSSQKKYDVGLKNLQKYLLQQNFELIYLNTIASAWVLPKLDYLKIPIIAHLHELPFSIDLYSTENDRNYLFSKTNKLIACSQAVADNLVEKYAISSEKIVVIHSFVDNKRVLNLQKIADNKQIKEKYHLPINKFIVGGCGNAEWRKGLDIFILLVRKTLEKNPTIHFVWVGIPKAGEMYEKLLYDIEKLNISNNLTLIEPTSEAIELLNCLNIFTLVSREDPFPLVMLEAALLGKPIVGFEKTGGVAEFAENDAGFMLPYLDIDKMAERIITLAGNPEICQKIGEKAKSKVLEKYNFQTSIIEIEKAITTTSYADLIPKINA